MPWSHPVRGAWIEIKKDNLITIVLYGRTPSGVRGLKSAKEYFKKEKEKSHPVRGAWIEISKFAGHSNYHGVAPRQGCVD